MAEEYQGCDANEIVHGASKVWMNDDNRSIKFIELDQPLSMSPQLMEGWLKRILKADAKTGFTLFKTMEDKLGNVHYRFRQTYNGYVVTNGVYYVHTRNGQVISANGEYYPEVRVNTNSIITTDGAIAIGKEYIHGHVWAWADEDFPLPELQVVYADEAYHFVYKTDIYSYEPIAREWVFIDAISGEVVTSYNRIHTNAVQGEAHCRYHGVQTITVDSVGPNEFRLRDATRGDGVETYDLNEGSDYPSAVDFMDEDNVWDTDTNMDDAALDAHWGTESMYDYMLNVHNWESYDGNGTVMLSYVHYGISFHNAFWDGSRMTYGDGNGYDAGPLTSTEVVAHEVMHGVTEFSAGLLYSDESGGLNEGYSDCFGVILDYEINPLTANFLIGDDFSDTGTPFRNMGNPNEYGNPDTYLGDFWDFNSGPHNWSGPQNFWFYLVTQGGIGTNDIGNDYQVDAISMADAADVLWRSLSVYLTPNSTYEDARFYGIQSAAELYGSCTDQVISVTNGWYAVGLGEEFTNIVASNFNSSSNYNCQLPAFVQFNNNSFNATDYSWDFGNGMTSTDENPTAEYTAEGTYTVTLISNGLGLCGNSDTLVLLDYITVTNTGGTTIPSCTPLSTSPSSFQGVFLFDFVDINNSSNGSVDNYQDYTCTFSTDLQEGVLYPFTIETGLEEMIRVWADVDSDGIFDDTNELIYASTQPSNIHDGQMMIPDTDIYGSPLRLRVKSDVEGSDISDPCNTVANGQVEDYTIILSENSQAPITNFVASQTLISEGTTVTFTDLTQNCPESWSWEFEGGIPAISTDQHPQVTYSAPGTYTVSLIAANVYGEATEVKTQYITVSNVANMCTNVEMNSIEGIMYDSGGQNGNYSDNESCSFLISPDCATNLTLTFTEFNVEDFFDFLIIYDGEDDSGGLIGFYTGTAIPPPTVSATGSFFIQFFSGFNGTFPGWEATWTSTVVGIDADIQYTGNPAVNAPVVFEAVSTNAVSWLWDFGDGNTSTDEMPTHTYQDIGPFTVTLTVVNAANCSLTVTSSVDITTGIDEIETDISIYPNPTSGAIFINNVGNERYHEIEIFNAIGQVVKRVDTSAFTGNTYQLNMDEYPTGVYTVGLKFEDNLSLHKKIVLHKTE